MALVGVIAGYALDLSLHRLESTLAFVGVCAILIFVGACVVAVFANRNYRPNIRRLGPHIHFDLDAREGARFKRPMLGRCVVRDPERIVSVSASQGATPFLWVRYPIDFPGAPPIIPGRYRATWEVERKPRKWRVLLAKHYRESGQAASSRTVRARLSAWVKRASIVRSA